jgi:tetratricopeptide (TPR) repeat protein
MGIVDCHVHLSGRISVSAVLEGMDRNGIERTILIPECERTSLEKTREKLVETRSAVAQAPDRLLALAWVNPVVPGMIELSEEALTEMGFAGLKIIPDHWFAYEERLDPFWGRMNDLKARILFHTGILYGFEDGSRFCKPLYLERLVHYPGIRFAERRPEKGEPLRGLGQYLSSAGKCDEALSLYRSAVASDPDGPTRWQWRFEMVGVYVRYRKFKEAELLARELTKSARPGYQEHQINQILVSILKNTGSVTAPRSE